MGDEPWERIGRCASGWIRTRPRSRWRWRSPDAVRFYGEIANQPQGRAAPDRAAGRQARQAQGLLRGRSLWLRLAAADRGSWARLHGGGALAGAAQTRRS